MAENECSLNRGEGGESPLFNALLYIDRGWPVLPLHNMRGGQCSCNKSDCSSPGKHPRTRSGHKDATTNDVQIRKWWAKWPDANIGIATGRESGLVVIDIDPRNGGDDTFSALCLERESFPDTLTARTGGGGVHLLFRYPSDGVTIKGRSHALGEGVDVKSDGGYIVAAPSLHSSGKRYEWANFQQPITDLPDWVLSLLENSPQNENLELIEEGRRNNTLASLAGKLVKQGKNEKEVRRLLWQANLQRCTPPLEDEEVERIAQSVSRYDDRPIKFRWLDHISDPKIELKAGEHHALMALSKWMGSGGDNCFPTIEQVAAAARTSRKTIGQHLHSAEKRGLIRRHRLGSNGRNGWHYQYFPMFVDV